MNTAIMNGNSQRQNQSKETRAARKLKKRFITREEARKQAALHAAKRMFKGAMVLDGAEAGPSILMRVGGTPKEYWVVYKNDENPLGFKSSGIVAVCKRTGRVLYEGTAGDEG